MRAEKNAPSRSIYLSSKTLKVEATVTVNMKSIAEVETLVLSSTLEYIGFKISLLVALYEGQLTNLQLSSLLNTSTA